MLHPQMPDRPRRTSAPTMVWPPGCPRGPAIVAPVGQAWAAAKGPSCMSLTEPRSTS